MWVPETPLYRLLKFSIFNCSLFQQSMRDVFVNQTNLIEIGRVEFILRSSMNCNRQCLHAPVNYDRDPIDNTDVIRVFTDRIN